MIKISLEDLNKKAQSRPSDYMNDVLNHGRIDGNAVILSPDAYRSLRLKYSSPPEWPLWAKALKKLASPDDKGIGDVVARMIGDEKSLAFKTWFRATFNRDCGCDGRQAQWNRQYPLNE